MSEDLDQFRAETRAWLEANCPAEMRTPPTSDRETTWGGRNPEYAHPDQKVWLDRMAARGWTVPDWPSEYGGGGLSAAETKILREELKRIKARNPLNSFGISMLGPALLKYGTEAQKLEHLPKIARGEIRWCQGYSEPNAGSDLAGLQTSAEDKGDRFLVNGQKVWTSYADKADWIFCLVRTDKRVKQAGISFLLFDMASPGVSTKPILLISGNSPFCETFFDNVEVPKANLLGELNKGWDVAKYLLGHEREMISGFGLGGTGKDPLVEAARKGADPILRAQIALFQVRSKAFTAMSEKFIDELKAGKAHPAQPSMMKYYGTELNKARHELQMAAGGSDALEWESDASHQGAAARTWLRTKANSIEGGTSEIQLNIIAKRILDLPSQLSPPFRGESRGQGHERHLPPLPAPLPASGEREKGTQMPLYLNDDQTMLRDTAKDFIASEAPIAHMRALRDADDTAGFSRTLWKQFAEMGFAGILIPEADGGLGLGHVEAGVVLEEIGRNLSPSPFLATAVAAVEALKGSAAARAWYPGILAGETVAALAIDEGAKHDGRIAMQAERAGNGFRLTGAKQFVTNGHVADLLLVAARTGNGTTLFTVAGDAQGLTATPQRLADSSIAARLQFDGVEVDADAVIGEVDQGDGPLARLLAAGRTGASAEMIGVGGGAMDMTVSYLRERKQFGVAIGSFQALQHRAAHLYSEMEVARAAVLKAQQLLDAGPEYAAAAAEAVAVAKAMTGLATTLAVQEGVQMHGGIGMTDEFDIGFFMKRARILAEMFGDSNFHANALAESAGY